MFFQVGVVMTMAEGTTAMPSRVPKNRSGLIVLKIFKGPQPCPHVLYLQTKSQLCERKKEGHFHYKNFLRALK